MNEVLIATRREQEFVEFLKMNGYLVDDLEGGIFKVTRGEELPVFINITDKTMYFEVDLGNISRFADKAVYFKLLDMNTEILPVSFGIDNTNPDDPRLVLVESRQTDDLSDQELLAVFDAMELATDKAEAFLAEYLK